MQALKFSTRLVNQAQTRFMSASSAPYTIYARSYHYQWPHYRHTCGRKVFWIVAIGGGLYWWTHSHKPESGQWDKKQRIEALETRVQDLEGRVKITGAGSVEVNNGTSQFTQQPTAMNTGTTSHNNRMTHEWTKRMETREAILEEIGKLEQKLQEHSNNLIS